MIQTRAATLLAALGVALCASAPMSATVGHSPTSGTPGTTPRTSTSAFEDAEVDDGVLDVQIVSVTPTPLTADSTLTVTASVTNRTSASVDGTLSLHAQGRTPSSRAAMIRWLDPDAQTATVDLVSTDIPELSPGATSEIRLEVGADALGTTTWGPRGLEVRATPSEPGESTESSPAGSDAERTWAVWWDESNVSPAPFAGVVPLVPLTEELLSGTTPPRYGALAEAGSGPGVSLLVDPSLLADDDPSVEALRHADEVWSLPWADADTAALLSMDRWDLAEESAERSTARLQDLGISAHGPVERAVDGGADLAQHSFGPVFVSSGSVEDWYRRGTPSGAVTLDGADAVVLDDFMQGAVRGRVTLDGDTYDLSIQQATQFLAGTTAAQVRENPVTSRLLAVMSPTDDDGTAAQLIAGMTELPWLSPSALSETDVLRAGSQDIATLVTHPGDASSAGGVTESELDRARRALEEFTELSDVVGDATSLRGTAFDELDLLAARALATEPDVREGLITDAERSVAMLHTGLEISVPSSLLMVSETSSFPVTVINHLPEAATVQLSLDATDLRLKQAERAVITLEPGEERRTEIPVTAVGSGDLTARIQLLTPSGLPLGEPEELEVQMRADWEGIGLITLISVGVVSFFYGLWRTIRRNRTEDRASEIKEAAELYEAQIARDEAEAAQAESRGAEDAGETRAMEDS